MKQMSVNSSCLSFVVLLFMVLTFSSAERSYSAAVEKLELTFGEETFIRDFKLKVTKFNRTTSVVNGTLEFLEDISHETMAQVISYQKYGTQYRRSIHLPAASICEFLEKEDKVYPDVLKVSNLCARCPLTKGKKYIKNYMIQEDHLPERVPPGEYWRIDIILSKHSRNVAIMKVYIHIQHYPQRLAGLVFGSK